MPYLATAHMLTVALFAYLCKNNAYDQILSLNLEFPLLQFLTPFEKQNK